MLSVILFVLALPSLILWGLMKMIEDLLNVFGYWIIPAVLSLYSAVLLYAVGPSAPGAAFESVFNSLSERVVLGARLPLWLLLIGFAMLALGAARNRARRGHVSAS